MTTAERKTPPPASDRGGADMETPHAKRMIQTSVLSGGLQAENADADPMEALISVLGNVGETDPCAEITVADFLNENLADDGHATLVQKIRQAVEDFIDGDTIDAMKKKLPAVMISGRSHGPRGNAMNEGRFTHSGWLQIDVDCRDIHPRTPEGIRALLVTDPHIAAAWISPKGNGTKAIMRIPVCHTEDEHRAAFDAAEAHILANYELRIDDKPKASNALCFLSYDPEMAVADEVPVELPVEMPAPGEGRRSGRKNTRSEKRDAGHIIATGDRAPLTAATVRDMLRTIPPRPDYDEWLRIASAVWDAIGEDEGTAALLAWSPEEKPGEYADKFKHRLKDVTAGTLWHRATECGWKPATPAPPKDKPAAAAPAGKSPMAFYYDGARYYLDDGQDFIPLDCRSVGRQLVCNGTDKTTIPAVICGIQTKGYIHHAGPLAGYRRGLHEIDGKRLLATSSPVLPEPRAGSWDTIRELLVGILGGGEHGERQIETIIGFWRFGFESVQRGKPRPCWAPALCGPVECGKSLLTDLTVHIFGGRRQNPYHYFTGRTHFNADLAGAELLVIDDEAGSTDIRARKHLAAAIKNNLFAGSVRIEGKHRIAFTLRPCWRLMFALNDEPESLLILPPLTEDIRDKIAILKCTKAPLPMPAHTLEEKETFFAKLVSEIPAMLHDAIHVWEPGEEILDERCGIKTFHHPDLLAAMNEIAPEASMMDLIDAAHEVGGIALPWEGTAAALRSLLAECSVTTRPAAALLDRWQPACGSYLGKLSKSGDRVERLTTVRGLQRWRITD